MKHKEFYDVVSGDNSLFYYLDKYIPNEFESYQFVKSIESVKQYSLNCRNTISIMKRNKVFGIPEIEFIEESIAKFELGISKIIHYNKNFIDQMFLMPAKDLEVLLDELETYQKELSDMEHSWFYRD